MIPNQMMPQQQYGQQSYGGGQQQQQNLGNNKKYKTMLCRHFQSNGNCQLGEKCAFAHGQPDLRKETDPVPTGATLNPSIMKMQGFPSNYKTAKCQYFEKGGFCKNGISCTFAHGDTDMRTLNSNFMQLSAQANGMQQMQQMQMMQMPVQNYMNQAQYYQPTQQMPPGMMSNPNDPMQQQMMNSDATLTIKAEAMVKIIKSLEALLTYDPDATKLLETATKAINVNNFEEASNYVQEVMNDSKRTPQEVQQYNLIWNEAQNYLSNFYSTGVKPMGNNPLGNPMF